MVNWTLEKHFSTLSLLHSNQHQSWSPSPWSEIEQTPQGLAFLQQLESLVDVREGHLVRYEAIEVDINLLTSHPRSKIRFWEKPMLQARFHSRRRDRRRGSGSGTPLMHLSTRSGSWDFPLKSPKTQPVIRRPSKSSIGCNGIILGVAWIPSITVRPQPCIHIRLHVFQRELFFS